MGESDLQRSLGQSPDLEICPRIAYTDWQLAFLQGLGQREVFLHYLLPEPFLLAREARDWELLQSKQILCSLHCAPYPGSCAAQTLLK